MAQFKLNFSNILKAIPLLILFNGCVQKLDTHPENKTYVLESAHPDKQAIKISNQGTSIATFKLKVNDNLYFDNDDIVNTIKELKSEFPDEPLEMKAWRFVQDNIDQQRPLTEEKWQHSPVIMINSLGFGQCDDYATVLALLWKKLGYKSRIWTLGGHTVPEVYVDGKWKMFDASYEVYYRNETGEIAGVKELIERPSLITKPLDSLHSVLRLASKINRYAEETAESYMTREDNKISEWHLPSPDSFELVFQIPPNASIEFPAVYNSSLTTSANNSTPSYANLKLTLPKGWDGPIDIPLIVHSISGKGEVTINDKLLEIESEELTLMINDRTLPGYKLLFGEIKAPVDIVYLINPYLVGLKNENQLSLNGLFLDKLNVELVELSPSERIHKFSWDDFILEAFEKNDNRIYRVNSLYRIDTVQIFTRSDFTDKLKLVIYTDEGLSINQKKEKLKLLNQKFENVYLSINDNVFFKTLFSRLNKDSLFVVFVSILENESEEFIIELLYYFRDFKF